MNSHRRRRWLAFFSAVSYHRELVGGWNAARRAKKKDRSEKTRAFGWLFICLSLLDMSGGRTGQGLGCFLVNSRQRRRTRKTKQSSHQCSVCFLLGHLKSSQDRDCRCSPRCGMCLNCISSSLFAVPRRRSVVGSTKPEFLSISFCQVQEFSLRDRFFGAQSRSSLAKSLAARF